jgi:hypothetical protein
MSDEPEYEEEFGHEQTLQQMLLHLLRAEAGDLEELCELAGVPVLTDAASSMPTTQYSPSPRKRS